MPDPKTGLLNLPEFNYWLREHEDLGAPATLIVLDVVDAAGQNRKAAHEHGNPYHGDQQFIRLARFMRAHAGVGDVLGRIGGDLFAWLALGPPSRAVRLKDTLVDSPVSVRCGSSPLLRQETMRAAYGDYFKRHKMKGAKR